MTQTKHRRSRPRQHVQFKRVQSYIHPRNIAFLTAESKETGQSLSGLVNDAVTIFRRMYQGEPILGGEPSFPHRRKDRDHEPNEVRERAI